MNMNEQEIRTRLLEITAVSAEYCTTLENASEFLRSEFVDKILSLLPRIYMNFREFNPIEGDENYYGQSYMEEDYYESVRRKIEGVMGAEDMFLETFVEDMKYSDTPIAVSVSECLADIFQPLYDFVSAVRESDGEGLTQAYMGCRDSFEEYWSQILCNVLGALNSIRTLPDE